MNEIDYIVELLNKYLEDKQRYVFDKEFLAMLEKHPFLNDLLEELESKDDIKSTVQHFFVFSESNAKSSEDRMLAKVLAEVELTKKTDGNKISRIWRYGLVASVFLLVFFAVLWIKKVNDTGLEIGIEQAVNDFAPGSNKAVLQLADGQVIELSSSHKGIVAGEQLSYDDGTFLTDSLKNDGIVSNLILSTPKGGQYQVILPDGTKVWLNADSRLVYPARFSDKVRKVEVYGEAYFEVKQNKEKPFVVHTMNETVEVLGTHFNVNSYKDEKYSSVSLIEGSVKVVLPSEQFVIIKPGQQSLLEGKVIKILNVDVGEILAWKNGEFMFNNENLESVARKLARWYDLEIEVSADLKDVSIWGSVSRYDNFNKVFDIIKMTDSAIQFTVEGRRIRFMK